MNRMTFTNMKEFTASVDHTREVITAFERLSNNFKSAQIYTTTYAHDSLGNFYKLYKSDGDSVRSNLRYLAWLVNGNLIQEKLVQDLTVMMNIHQDRLMEKNISELINLGEGWRLNELFKIHKTIDEGISNENKLLAMRKHELNDFTQLTNILTTSFGIVAVGIIVVTFLSNLFLTRQRIWLEGFLESILNTSQSGMMHYKAIREKGSIVDFRIRYVNKAIDKLMGIKPGDIMGKRLTELPFLFMQGDLFNQFVQVVETGQPAEFENPHNQEGNERWFLVSLAKLDDGLIASFNNITQLKKYEEELKENISELERSNKELEQYAYVASHDLQEPLRKIRSFGSFLQDTQAGRLDKKGQDQLSKILSAAERMSTLIKDILSFSSLKKQQSYVPTDLNLVLKSVLQDLDLMIDQKKAVIETDQLPVIEAIPLQMNQLFYNLINNSLKFSKENQVPEISVRCRKIGPEEKTETMLREVGYYEIEFSDNGIGFSPEYAAQIFGLFKRLNDRKNFPGSGIGLALCKKVVDNHHGEIVAMSSENDGASFYVYLPEKQI